MRTPNGVSGQAGDARAQILAALESRSTLTRVERDAEIVAQEDAATCCYLVVSGCVRTVRLMEDGRRQARTSAGMNRMREPIRRFGISSRFAIS